MGNKETDKDLIFTGYHQVFRTQAHYTQNYDQRAQVCACEFSRAEKHSCSLSTKEEHCTGRGRNAEAQIPVF